MPAALATARERGGHQTTARGREGAQLRAEGDSRRDVAPLGARLRRLPRVPGEPHELAHSAARGRVAQRHAVGELLRQLSCVAGAGAAGRQHPREAAAAKAFGQGLNALCGRHAGERLRGGARNVALPGDDGGILACHEREPRFRREVVAAVEAEVMLDVKKNKVSGSWRSSATYGRKTSCAHRR